MALVGWQGLPCYYPGMNPLERFAGIVAANQFMTLSSVHGGEPWISPLYFAADEHYRLYFISRRDSQHAENIRSHQNVAVAIFDSTCTPGHCDGAQIAATARELDASEEVAYGASVLFGRRFADEAQRQKYLDPARYRGDELMRIYEVRPRAIFVVDQSKPNDYRVEVQLP